LGLISLGVIVDANILLVGVFPVQASGVLLQASFPGDRHSQHQGVERRMVEAFADQAAGGEQDSRGSLIQCIQL